MRLFCDKCEQEITDEDIQDKCYCEEEDISIYEVEE